MDGKLDESEVVVVAGRMVVVDEVVLFVGVLAEDVRVVVVRDEGVEMVGGGVGEVEESLKMSAPASLTYTKKSQRNWSESCREIVVVVSGGCFGGGVVIEVIGYDGLVRMVVVGC